ncbi:MAG: hypothetical protein CMP06_12850 [Xanthomonadales bacterium]|nr:hypothetical protein [Xanthomonadales bacterium]
MPDGPPGPALTHAPRRVSRGALTNNYAGDCWLVRVEQIAGVVLFIGGVDAQTGQPRIRLSGGHDD